MPLLIITWPAGRVSGWLVDCPRPATGPPAGWRPAVWGDGYGAIERNRACSWRALFGTCPPFSLVCQT